ncbi:hypothetical protein [Microbacterium sp. H1-D42]|uniref:hypothetical protein n=1 Tax=Microbacterium sp. H1-D42 TaxID=2925844 RepID=UPI001F530418|nr:hypothetical protein [Microbacterium sp. H1-D42]UNK71172.1 hypothetical protein MNR00_01610 [Microbacterium sp. H1-D42]
MSALSDAGSLIESDAVARDNRARRRTWVIGGALLVLSALVVLVRVLTYRAGIVGESPAWAYYIKDWLWGIGALILVIGLGRAGSITGRRPFATILVILQIIVASPAAAWYLSTRLPDLPTSTHAAEDAWTAVFIPYYLAVFALTFTAALAIGLVRAVPAPWCWAPSVAFLVAIVFGSAVSGGAYVLGGFSVVYLPVISTGLLGMLAIVLGIRAGRDEPAETRRPLPEFQEGSAQR